MTSGAASAAAVPGGAIELAPAARAISTKADLVFEALRIRLIEGVPAYGEMLNTVEIAERFGVSRRPVMDAMGRLELAGFIEIIAQVGCRVVVPERRTVREHFYTAGVIDGAAARLAATAATDVQRRALREALNHSGDAAAANDQHAFELANKRFHATLLAAGGNERLAQLARQAWDLSDFYLQRRSEADLRRSHAEHERIAEAILAGDADTARDAAEAHLARFGEAPILPGDQR
jgi:GntR family transcriptional regulator, rspAB operon transcriptional repressor